MPSGALEGFINGNNQQEVLLGFNGCLCFVGWFAANRKLQLSAIWT